MTTGSESIAADAPGAAFDADGMPEPARGAVPADNRLAPPPDPSPAPSSLPYAAVLGAVSGLAIVGVSLHPFRDIDLYWHLLAGEQLALGASPSALGEDWSYAPVAGDWVSTQWVAELLLYWVHLMGGWTWLAALRVLTAATAIAVLARTTLKGRPKALAGWPFVLAVGAVAVASQERPQQASLIGAAVLGGVLFRGIHATRLPRWYLLVPLTILWANVHGGWVLVPFSLGLIALGGWIDGGLRSSFAWRAAGTTALATACGLVTPAGIESITAPLRFQSAATLVQEWQRTTPFDSYGAITLLMLGLVVLGWTRAGEVRLPEVISVMACLLLAWTAWRNIAPAMALVAPLVAHRLTLAFPGQARRLEPRWSVPVGFVLAVVLGLVALLSLPGAEHLPRDTQPIGLAEKIATLPPGQRVLNHYNASGVVLFFGGPDVSVGIDGRTDRYGAEYIEDYTDLGSLEGDWQAMLDQLSPTSALMPRDAPIVHVLVEERGWKMVAEEGDWVLLVP